MALTINSNVASLVAQMNFNKATTNLNKTFHQLSSGYRVNSAKDDAAGMAISVGFTNQIRGAAKAQANLQDGINLMQTAESGMETTTESINRIRELCLQAANGVNDEDNLSAMLAEIKQRLEEIDTQASALSFNEIPLLDGTTTSLRLQIGSGYDPSSNSIDIADSLCNMKISSAGLDIELNVATGADWETDDILDYIGQLDGALDKIMESRSKIGAYTSRLNAVYDNLTSTSDNMTEARSRIMDVDFAQGGSDLMKYQILQQVTTNVLTQANQLPELALSLLGR